jgi:hypothetical protein
MRVCWQVGGTAISIERHAKCAASPLGRETPQSDHRSEPIDGDGYEADYAANCALSLWCPGRRLPVNVQLAAYYNTVTPKGGAKWQARFQVQLLFPK